MITTGEAAAQPIRIERQDLGFEMGETFLCTGGSFVLLQSEVFLEFIPDTW